MEAPPPSSKPPCRHDDALAVLRRLRSHGHVAYFAGGCVRDLLLGLVPKDFDVATDAHPARVRELFSNTQAVGAAFGVILVKHGPSTVEVATFRSEGSYSDGRHPDRVAFTTAHEDAQRRDFTINGLFMDPTGESDGPSLGQVKSTVTTPHGKVIDYVGGVTDLHNRILRAIGDPNRRFAEDHLRLLRAVRFAARFTLAIEPETARAIRVNAPRLRGISPERIADELRAMLTPISRAGAWPLLWDFALIDVIFRFLPSGESCDFDPARSLFLRIAPHKPLAFPLALAAASLEYRMQSVPPEVDPVFLSTRPELQKITRAAREALRLSNHDLDDLHTILAPLPALLGNPPPRISALKRFLALNTSDQTRLLLDAFTQLNLHIDRVQQLNPQLDQLARSDVAPPPLITGDDLAAAGYKPGPLFKRLLDAVYDAQLENQVTSREEALALARSLVS